MGIKITNTGGNGSFKVKNLGSGGYFKATGTTIPTYSADDWIRPSDWLEMPTIGTQEFIGLLAITDDESNHIALLFAGAYTVDWGDGTSENVATGVKAQHSYTYSAISDSTISSRGYKQVLVRVTPQAGQNLTTVNLQQQHSTLGKRHAVGWLQLAVKGSNITTLFGSAGIVNIAMCENVDIYSWGSITSVNQLFAGFAQLQRFTVPSTAAITNFSNMFQQCSSLKTIPLIDTSAGTTFTNMFGQCATLRTIPLLNTSAGTLMNTMFNQCGLLQNIPLINTRLNTNFTDMFADCGSLQVLPNLNTASGSSFTRMINSDVSLAKGAFQGTRYSISYASMCLGKSAVLDIFNGLGTASGSQTITITTNPAFNGKSLFLSKGQFINWRGSAVHGPTQDVYVSAQSGYIYRQAGGSGSFEIDRNVADGAHRQMGTDVYGNVYCALGGSTNILKKTAGSGSWNTVAVTGVTTSDCIAGDFLGNLYICNSTGLYKQTALTGSFTQVYPGNITTFDISPFDGSIYLVSGSSTYKQTAGTGSFDLVQAIAGYIACRPNGDVYASNGTLYKQTAGTGSFVSMGINTVVAGQMSDKADGNLYQVGYQQDVYYTDLINDVVTPTDRLIATNKGWTIA